MFLKHIKLYNFKCLEDIELSFEKTKTQNRKWTLILGENGTGKSNLLKAIALVTSGSNALGQLLGNSDSWIKNNQDYCQIDAVIETKKGDQRNVSLRIDRGVSLSDIIISNQHSLSLIDSAISNAQRNYFVVAYGASRRLSTYAINSEKETYGRFNNVKTLFYSSESLNPLANWIMDLDYERGETGLAVVRETLNNFLIGTKFHGIDKAKKEVIFETTDGMVPLEQLSDGYQNIAAWIGDLLFRLTQTFKDYINPLEARGLILIDEIDLHLHPKWQRILLEFISNKLPNFQVVATTHSPLTAQQADEGELYALKRDEDLRKIYLLPFHGSPQKLLVNQLLMTPVFGLDTDESLEIENSKIIYDEFKSKENLSDQERKEFIKVRNYLKNSLPQRDLPKSSENQTELLKKIEAHLNSLT